MTKARNNSSEANVVEESPSTAKANKKKKKNKKSAKISSIPPKPKENKKKGKQKVAKNECYFCDKAGNFKKDYQEYLSKKGRGNSHLHFIEAYSVDDFKELWVVDSGATNHICVSLHGFKKIRNLSDRHFTLRTGMEQLNDNSIYSKRPRTSENNGT